MVFLDCYKSCCCKLWIWLFILLLFVQGYYPSNKPGVEPRRPCRPVNITPWLHLSTVTNRVTVTWGNFGKVETSYKELSIFLNEHVRRSWVCSCWPLCFGCSGTRWQCTWWGCSHLESSSTSWSIAQSRVPIVVANAVSSSPWPNTLHDQCLHLKPCKWNNCKNSWNHLHMCLYSQAFN